jgi:general secretion pathway protein D
MRLYFLYFFFFINTWFIQNIRSEGEPVTTKKVSQKRTNKKKKIIFSFADKPLVEIINELAAEKNENIILPQGAQAITTKVTYHYAEPLTIDQAWQQLSTILALAGYSIEPEASIQTIRKIDQNINRQILSVYINEPLENIPDTENIIRAVFYLANINLKTSFQDLKNILQDMLSQTAKDNGILSDAKTNALILTDQATNIKAAMRIILELDKGGMRDSIEIIPLYYTSSDLVERLFNENLLASKQQPGAGAGTNGGSQPEQPSYFPKNTKIIGLPRNNTLVIMGTPFAIDLVKDFIIKYIDRPLESGESILHVYDLQYLDAKDFAPVLQQILLSGQMPGQQATGQTATGPKQYFKDVIVVNEIPRKTKEQLQPTTVQGETEQFKGLAPSEGAQVGGNRLVIAARKKDWVRIKELIEQLDKPQLQVALEVIVCDVTLNSNKLLGSQLRDKDGFNKSISERVNFQTAHLSQPILKMPSAVTDQRPANALMSNLLQLGDPFGENENLATSAEPGSLVFSLKDSANGGVWSFWQILNNYTNATLIAQPFVITQNHQQATVTIAQQRFLAGKADSSNVAVKVGNEWVTASFTIDILPHISATGNINLQITVKINQFVAGAETGNNTRVTRAVQTNANVGNGEILALGGLTRESENIQASETPPFSNFPIIGWFFKKKQQVKQRNNLLILMSPTIIQPRLKGGIDTFTDKKLTFAQEQLDESMCFDNLRDPVNRWFFKPNPFYGKETVEEYTKKTTQEDISQNNQEQKQANNQQVVENSYAPTVCVSRGELSAQACAMKELVKNEKNPLTLPIDDKSEKPIFSAKKQEKTQSSNDSPNTQQLKDLLQAADNPLLIHQQEEKGPIHLQS